MLYKFSSFDLYQRFFGYQQSLDPNTKLLMHGLSNTKFGLGNMTHGRETKFCFTIKILVFQTMNLLITSQWSVFHPLPRSSPCSWKFCWQTQQKPSLLTFYCCTIFLVFKFFSSLFCAFKCVCNVFIGFCSHFLW